MTDKSNVHRASMQSRGFTSDDVPLQSGKLAIVTGTGGLGYETALVLAQKGAEVILAGRNKHKGQESIAKIISLHPNAKITFELLDLASLKSVTEFAQRLAKTHPAIHLLVNNAGVMMPPERRTTQDGFELQFGTNYLGHFALTSRLLPQLIRGKARVVSLSSFMHRLGKIHLDDLQFERKYSPVQSYSQSKLAMLMFALELQKQSDAHGWGLMSNAAHPGYARTELIANGPGLEGLSAWINVHLLQPFISHSAAAGALPTLYAATSPNAAKAGYYGPNGYFELKGSTAPSYISKPARDATLQKKLWDASEILTGVKFQS
jgi:NAD(P)-dependent dehydrogenase (short-subunit alcohol dehydrogenase family)